MSEPPFCPFLGRKQIVKGVPWNIWETRGKGYVEVKCQGNDFDEGIVRKGLQRVRYPKEAE